MTKKPLFLSLVFVLFFGVSAVATEPGEYGHFSNIYVFGTSLSDNGNFANVIGPIQQYFPYYYWEGRWSNGPIWAEYLAKKAHANLINFAFGTATTGESTHGSFYPYVPTVLDQINAFCNSGVSIPPDSLFIVEGGANDFFQNPFGSPLAVVQNIMTGVNLLKQAGAEQILVVNLPDLGMLPAFQKFPGFPQLLSAVTQAYNSALAAAVSSYALANPEIAISLFDMFGIMTAVTAEPWKYSIKNVTEESPTASALNTEIDFTLKHYFFWDFVHPSTLAHEISADFIGEALKTVAKGKVQ